MAVTYGVGNMQGYGSKCIESYTFLLSTLFTIDSSRLGSVKTRERKINAFQKVITVTTNRK